MSTFITPFMLESAAQSGVEERSAWNKTVHFDDSLVPMYIFTTILVEHTICSTSQVS